MANLAGKQAKDYLTLLTPNHKDVRLKVDADIISESVIDIEADGSFKITSSNLTTKYNLAGLNKDNLSTYTPTNSVEKVFRKGHNFVEADIKSNETYILVARVLNMFTLVLEFATDSKDTIILKKELLYSDDDDVFQAGQGMILGFDVGSDRKTIVGSLNKLGADMFMTSSDNSFGIENFEVGKTFKDLVLYSDKSKGDTGITDDRKEKVKEFWKAQGVGNG
jgi:hypothetical protein